MKYNQPRVQGRYASPRWHKFILKCVIVGIIAWIGIGAYLDRSNKPVVYTAPALTPIVKAIEKIDYEARVKKVKHELVNDLAEKCESRGAKDPDGIIIFDSNNEASIGAWQYQRKTVMHYIKKFEGRDITAHEAIAIAIDHEKAFALTEKILFTEQDGWKNWFNCGNKLGLAARIALINEIMQ
jgi:hypothetical protein